MNSAGPPGVLSSDAARRTNPSDEKVADAEPAGAANGARRRVLMICYLFPPAGGSAIPAVQRVVKFVRGMTGSRWEPVVLTIAPEYYESYISREAAFLNELPPGTRIERTARVMAFKTVVKAAHRLRAALTRRRSPVGSGSGDPAPAPTSQAAQEPGAIASLKSAFDNAVQTPDPHIGWLPHAYRRGRSLVRQAPPHCLYATGSPWSGLLVGALLKRSTGIPLVLDFRDPWVTNPYRAHFPSWRKRVEQWLEGYTVRSADLVIANTRGLRDEFRARYTGPAAPRFEAVYNSVDRRVAAPPAAARPGARIRLAHAGFFYGPRDPLSFLRAVARRRYSAASGLPDDLAVDLIGAVELEYSLENLLSELRIDDIVTLHGPVPHAHCDAMLRSADAYLLLQPGTKTQLPSKLFEYVTFGKPILTLAEPGGETYRFAAEELTSLVADCADEEDIVNSLDTLVRDLREQRGVDADGWRRKLSDYSSEAITAQFLMLLDSAMEQKKC